MKVLILSLLVIFGDQFSKFAVKYFFQKGQPNNIIGDVIRLTYIENPGMAFGIDFGGQPFFTIFASLATVVIFVYIVRAREENIFLRMALALILGGAIGNLIDRILYGKVVDFIDIGAGGTRWPVFNLADSAVTIGMIMLITMSLFYKGPRKSRQGQDIHSERQAF